jgi:hypothetical protein
VVLITALVVGWFGCAAPSARADGDPASDVLASQDAFLPADAGASARQPAQLTAVVRAAAAHGLPIRVAVISSPADLGSVSALWHRPQPYAEFLGEELSLMFSGQVLVVMPNGFGLYHAGLRAATERAALAHTSSGGSSLAAAAIAAVEQLAASTGHPLPQVSVATGRSTVQTGSGSGALSWAVLGAGLVLIAVAWTASLRVAPPQRRAGHAPTTLEG